MARFDANRLTICDIIKMEYEDYIFDLMAKSKDVRGSTVVRVKKEIGFFIYKREGDWEKTGEVEGDSYSIEAEDINRLSEKIPSGASDLFFIHTHPNEVTGFSPHDLFAFVEAIGLGDRGMAVVEEGDEIIVNGIEIWSEDIKPDKIIDWNGKRLTIFEAVRKEIEKMNTGDISPGRAKRNIIKILEPYTKRCRVIIPR